MPATAHDPGSSTVAAPPKWRGFELGHWPEVSEGVEVLGRVGHFAKGIVYFIVGLLAFRLAIGAGGEITDTRGAIEEIGQQPFGRVLLGLIAIGLIGYTIWRWVQAGLNTEGHPDNARGIILRIGYLLSGAAYFALGCYSGARALGLGGRGDEGDHYSILDSTAGRFVLGVAGAIVICVALGFFFHAYKAKFMSQYNWVTMSERMRTIALYVGRAGVATRAISFILIGWFLLSAAWRGTHGGEVSDLADALAAIASHSYGKGLLGAAGLGLMCYAVHLFLLGWYRGFNVVRR